MDTYRHASGAFSLELPDGWQAEEGIEQVALLATAPEADLGFTPNMVVTVEALATDPDPTDWFQQHSRNLVATLEDPQLIDVGLASVGGFVAQRVLVHHELDGHAVTLEQWACPVAGFGWFLSFSVASLVYDRWVDLAQAMADSFELLGSDSA